MKFYSKSVFLLLLLNTRAELFSGTAKSVKELPEYDAFVLKNILMQDIYLLLEGKSQWEKDEIQKYIYSDANLTSLPYSAGSDKTTIDEIKTKIRDLSYLPSREAEEVQQLTSTCLKSLPKRGIAYSLSTILYCFKLAENKVRAAY